MKKTLVLLGVMAFGFLFWVAVGVAATRIYRAVTAKPSAICRKMPIMNGELIRVKEGPFTFERNRIRGQVNLERLIDGRFGTGCKPEFWVTGQTLMDLHCNSSGKLERQTYHGSRDDLPDNVAADFKRMSALADQCDAHNPDR